MQDWWQFIIHLDVQLFYFLNMQLAHPFLDKLMVFVTRRESWSIPSVIAWLFLVIKGGANGRRAAIMIIPVLILSDQVSHAYLKPWVDRLRPCKTLENFRLLISCGGRFSFPSVHAVNIAALAMLLSYYFSKFTPAFILLAVVVGFSRIYVGVHYPLDILGGFIIGIFFSLLGLLVYDKLIKGKFTFHLKYRRYVEHNKNQH